MAGFRFEALTDTGRTQRGVLEADSPRQARSRLREQGLIPVELEPIQAASDAGSKRIGWRNPLPGGELAIATRQLATLLGAGLTVEQTLNALIEQAENEPQRQLFAAVRSDVLAGQALARSLGNQSRVFPELYRTLVDAGERSGKLSEVLLRLADYTEDRDTLRGKVGLAFIYPAIIIVVAIVIVSALLAYVVPQVVQVFQNTNQVLPLLTRMMIFLSDALRGGWYWILGVVIAAGVGAYLALQVPAMHMRWQRFLLRLPVIGPLHRSLNTARLASTLAILVGSKVPLLSALRAGAGVITNAPMREALGVAAQRVQEGSTLSRALAASKLFPSLMVHMIASGESSGRLAEMLERTALQQTRELERRVGAMVALLEPVLILVMGAVVLVIVMAILLPIFEMNTIIR
jgi:general secretion pathway protein F